MLTKSRRLFVEPLEDRLAPAVFGNPWPDPLHLTLSFTPDGVDAGLGPSNLFQALNAVAPTAAWQLEILRAFQSWAVNANINVAVVPDGGQALGNAGAAQGDSRFGDIRIAGTAGAIDDGDVAAAQPFSWTGTTWSGDVVLNTMEPMGIGNLAGQYDLFSTFLHEAGHVFGLEHDEIDAGAAMNPLYSYHPQLSQFDIAHLQALYGARQQESVSNDTPASATALDGSSQGATVVADISTLQDVDYYKVQSPSSLTGFSGFNVQLKTSQISLLTAAVAVYDSDGRLVGSASATDPLHGDLSFNVTAAPSATYYVRVGSNGAAAFGIGGYQLSVTNQYSLLSLGGVITAANNGLSNTFASAVHLVSQNPGTDQRADYFVHGNLTSATGADYYLVQSPPNPTGGPQNMVAIVWALDVNALRSRVQVYDAFQNPIAVQVIANDFGTYAVQLPNDQPNASYFIMAAAADPNGLLPSTGKYALAVSFHEHNLVSFADLAGGNLTQAQSQIAGAMTASHDELFDFTLSVSTSNPNAWVMMTIVDQSGATVFTLKVQAGQPIVTGDVYLKKGTYSVRFSGYTTDGSSLSDLAFQLAGDVLSIPVGAYSTSPSSSGGSTTTSSSSSGSSTTSSNTSSGSSGPYYY